MKISVILAHPDIESFNAAIAAAAVEQLKSSNHNVIFHDLYQERFDPLLLHGEFPKDVALPPDIRWA